MSERGDGDKMMQEQLEHKITKVNSYGNGKYMVELENGHAISYERQNPNYGTVCTLIAWDDRLKPKINAGAGVCRHSKEMHDIINGYSSPLQRETVKLDRKIQDIYQKMTAPLEIKRNVHWKPHEGILGAMALTAYAGVMMAGAAYTFISDRYVRSAFLAARAKRQKEPLTEQLLEAAKWISFPVLSICAGVIYTEKSYSLRNESQLNTGEKGKDPAVIIRGKKGKTFDDLALIFPDGLKIRKEWGNSNWSHFAEQQEGKLHSHREENRSSYSKSTEFVRVDEALRSELYSLVEKKEQVETNWRLFEKQIRGKEIEFLNKLGFKED